MLNFKLFIILVAFSTSSLAEECISKSKMQEMLGSGVFDSFFKHRVVLEEQLSNLEMINLARTALNSADEDQLTVLKLIDKKTNMQLEEIALAATIQENKQIFLSQKKRIKVVIETIRNLREGFKSQVQVDETPLNNLESLFSD
ncbi:hypothetical protein J8M21_25705 [Pseudoalteromonas luteoviolacea]|uniref:hypothetical protein n=1 Tax=Pseudoalteromonas luteoviolacea TaxID=43657 RepID=UPI001B39EF80|nr:hypothetical protein [Pseudoalteromonas luteoviolacea]MBQ4880599.1 hypothetical protein [Pseudoalteromonas luteoviolacea]MBQ4909640.1 hypothetical protein [Pseudoalteromonas luteoviolacea]